MSPAQARQWGFPFFPAFFSLFFSSFFSFFTLGVLTLPGVLPCCSEVAARGGGNGRRGRDGYVGEKFAQVQARPLPSPGAPGNCWWWGKPLTFSSLSESLELLLLLESEERPWSC